ncbi:HTH gntR-type domain-containing protein [Ruminococcaceae bacterium BL-6]|nr:HTH gntR-type domain-containing protein [Ruminococcaceae bacterium BL-6]
MPKDYQKELAIREDLAYQIQHHRFAEGEKLPSEYELAEKYDVTRITVRNVYLTLQEMGFIYSKQGVGHFVQKKIGNIELLLKSGSSFSEKMRRQNIPCETVNLFCRRISYSKALFERLEASENEEVFCIARLRILYHFPAAIHFSYLLKSRFPTIDRDGPSITSIFDYYRRLGHRNLLASPATLSAGFPSRQEKKWLQCGALVPLLVLEHDCVDADSGETLEKTRSIYRSDIFQHRVKF